MYMNHADKNGQLRRKVGLVAVISVLVLAGCNTGPNYHHVDHTGGEISATDGTFHMNGNIAVGIGNQPHQNYSKVAVVLYDNQKNVIKRVPVGDLSTLESVAPLSQPINVTSDRIPKYITIESPDFWTQDGTLYVESYNRVDNEFEYYSRESRGEKFADDDGT